MMNLSVNNIYDWPLTTRLLIALLLGALVFYIGYWLDFSRLKEMLNTSQGQEENLKQQYEMVVRKQADLKTELSQYPEFVMLMAQWQQKLIHRKNLPELMNDILKIGGNNRLYFNTFDPQDEIEDNGYTKVPVNVIAVGNYHQISNFISQVANMPNIVVITNFSITNENKNNILGEKVAKEASAANLLTANITLEIYLAEKKPQTKVKEQGQKPVSGAASAPQPSAPTAAKPESTTNAH